jgi:glycosyltransferase involved in cell wall biosynthesis
MEETTTATLPARVAAIIPALNEEEAISRVLEELPRNLVSTVIVVDNGSTDCTAEAAKSHGATVVSEPRRGYGRACLAGIAALPNDIEIVLFLDADGSDYPEDAQHLLEPIARSEADLVIGSRVLGRREAGALLRHQELANRAFTGLIRLLYRHRYTDLGPFRAIRRASLEKLQMHDPNFGWTVEMQVKALRHGLRVKEVPVRYRQRRAGKSKISGNWIRSTAAGCKIVWTTLRLYFSL